jgi:hypothetical protein
MSNADDMGSYNSINEDIKESVDKATTKVSRKARKNND